MHIKRNRLTPACREGKSISKYSLLNSKFLCVFHCDFLESLDLHFMHCVYIYLLMYEQKLSFSMVHGRKSMADERKLLREINASQGKDGGMTLDELHAPVIFNLEHE